MKGQTLDILIPSYHPGPRFLELLTMLSRQRHLPEHIFILNTEEDGFSGVREDVGALNADPASRLSGRIVVSHIRKEEFDHAGTRNRLAELSGADVILFMTDDAVPADEFLTERLLEALYGFQEASRRGVTPAAAFARQLAPGNAPEEEKFTRFFNYPEESLLKTADTLSKYGIKNYFLSDVCAAYRRDIFTELGGFREPAVFNEDMVFAHDAMERGYATVYAADAKVFHAHDYTAGQQLKRNFDLGMSQALHPEVFGGIRSEGEGMKLVKATAAHLLRTGHAGSIPRYLFRTAHRYLGFRLGKAYEKLPDGLVRRLTGSPVFTENCILKGKPGKEDRT